MRDFQAVIDSGDPINHIKDAVATVPVHLVKILNDAVVPNSATDRLIAQGPLRKLKTIGPNAVSAGQRRLYLLLEGRSRFAVQSRRQRCRDRRDAAPGRVVRRFGRAARWSVRGPDRSDGA
jgi:hypothetical protein